MATGAIKVNTSITKPSSLLVKKQGSVWHGPGESLQEGLDTAGYLEKPFVLWACVFIGWGC